MGRTGTPADNAVVESMFDKMKLEDELVGGSGAGEHLRGILTTPGIQTAGPPSGTGSSRKNEFDVIRTAKKLIRQNARTNATAVVMSPDDAERLDTAKTAQELYYAPGPFAGMGLGPVWGLPTIESEAIPAGFCLVGDFRKAVLFDREQTTLSVGTAGDDFIRNIVRVLAELRAGFGVTRPAAFCYVDLVP